MRLFLHNPHTESHFGITVLNYVTRNHSYRKYNYLLTYLKRKNALYIYVEPGASSFPEYIANKVPYRVEVFFWAIINGINPFRLHVATKPQDLKDNDAFFSFTLGNLDKPDISLDFLKNVNCLKVFHLSHYVANSKLIGENFKKIKGDYFIAESNLRKNSRYFRECFPNYNKHVYVLPFVFQKRFNRHMSFNKRKNICLATGSLIQLKEFSDSNKQYSDFLKFHPDGILHPLRATIIKNKKSLIQYIDSYMANFWEKKRKEWEEKSSFFTKWKNRIYNAAFASKRSYLKFNIVEKYNEYKMFVIPEEAIDLPGIGYVEGMACGTAYIGKIDPMYTDLGLIPGKHFIGYNGTLADLKKKINYYQKNNDKLEVIANSGYKFVSENFSEDTVAGRFWNDLETLNRKYEIKNSKNQLVFKSGFNKSIL